jgi:SAM-dependent MidA family methyltransferase
MKCPNPEMHEKEHSQKLTTKIRQEITRSGGGISFAQFMELALYAPGLGYYAAGKHKLGPKGDFLTAPEISPLFAKSIARQCQQISEQLSSYDILEFGAGSGVFAKDILIALEEMGAMPEHYYILEVSAELRDRQQRLLQSSFPQYISRIQWLDHLPSSPIQGVIFANEVMDALPVHSFDIQHDTIKERFVVWQNEQFCWESGEPVTPGLKQLCEALRETYALPNGYQSEIHLFLSAWIQSVADLLKKGVILLIDYGYGRAEYYHPDRSMGTLMCYYQHQKHDNPLILVGLQDVTAHVDFTTVIESADAFGCKLAGFTTQAAFLTACGLLEIAEKETHLSAKEKFQQGQAIKKLLFPSEMGEIIKVMALSKAWDVPLVGFSLLDRRRDL